MANCLKREVIHLFITINKLHENLYHFACDVLLEKHTQNQNYNWLGFKQSLEKCKTLEIQKTGRNLLKNRSMGRKAEFS